jgi:hypothetical protein
LLIEKVECAGISITEVMSVPYPENRSMVRFTVNPHLHFLVSETWAAVAGVGTYLIFRSGAWLIDGVASSLPVQDTSPANFLSFTLHWGGAIGGSATFALITIYQLVVLFKRLWAEVKE